MTDNYPRQQAESMIGPYRVIGELGRGGMGVVYRVVRPQLGREFALKTLRVAPGTPPEAVARFVREAQAAAKLQDHPGIVGVHDVGSDANGLWFAMDLVDGPSLEGRIQRGDITPRDVASIGVAVARALAHAHQLGFLHRDLKPSNILIAPDGTPRITDFGLVKLIAGQATGLSRSDGPKLTDTGAAVGTPAYMAPEQARGETLGPAADVYGLGATLYEALVGAPPFEAATAIEVLRLASTNDPVPPSRRDPTIPTPLETIVLKCLSKRPSDRYPTAEAVAKDLERWLTGAQIEARPPGALSRAKRWAGRNRVLVAAAATAVLVAIVVTALVAPRWMHAEQRAADSAAQAIASLTELADAHLEAALALRRADRVPEIAPHLDKVLDAAKAVLAVAPNASGPWYLIGRMQRATGQYADALESQTGALVPRPVHRLALYEWIVLAGRQYVDDQRAARPAGSWWIAGAAEPESGTAMPELPELAEPIQEAISRWVELYGSSVHAPPGHWAFVHALRAWIHGDLDIADDLTGRALAADPDCREAMDLQVRVLCARQDYAGAVARFDAAITTDPGDGWLRIRRAEARHQWATQQRMRGAPDPSLLAGARADRLAGIARGVRGRDPWVLLGEIEHEQGLTDQAAGRDGANAFRAAADALTQAIDLEPAKWLWPARRALMRANLAASGEAYGRNGSREFEDALADLDLAEQVHPGVAEVARRRACVLDLMATFAELRGQPGAGLRAQALVALERAIQSHPTEADLRAERGGLLLHSAIELERRGEDPGEHYEQAARDLDAAISAAPDRARFWAMRAELALARGRSLSRRGESPLAMFRAAEADWSAALERKREHGSYLCARAESRSVIGQCVGRTDWGASESLFTAAIADLEAAEPRRFDRAALLAVRARTYQRWGVVRLDAGQDPTTQYERAIEAATAALAIRADDAEVLASRGFAKREFAIWRKGTGENPTRTLESAADDLERALARRPMLADWHRDLGSVRFDIGVYLHQHTQDPSAAYAPAIAEYDRAIELDAKDGLAWQFRGNARFNLARWRGRQGEPTRGLYEGARADLQQAASLRPDLRPAVASLIAKCNASLEASLPEEPGKKR